MFDFKCLHLGVNYEEECLRYDGLNTCVCRQNTDDIPVSYL